VAITDVLPLMATRRDAIANWKVLGPRDTSDLISVCSVYIRYVAPPYFAGTIITASVYGRWVKLLPYFSLSGIALLRWETSEK